MIINKDEVREPERTGSKLLVSEPVPAAAAAASATTQRLIPSRPRYPVAARRVADQPTRTPERARQWRHRPANDWTFWPTL